MKRESRTVDRSHQVDSPLQRHLPLVDLLVDVRADLMELVVASGLKVLTTMLEADRSAICGPRYAHEPERAASRAGTVPGEVVLGGRKVQIRRPRVHVRSVLAEWVGHYNRGRPHAQSGARYPRSARRLPRAIFKRPSDPGRPPCRLQTGARRRAPRVSSR